MLLLCAEKAVTCVRCWYLFLLIASKESLHWIPRHVAWVHLPFIAWLLACSWIFFTVWSFAFVQVIVCYSQNCPSILTISILCRIPWKEMHCLFFFVSYALKFTPTWNTGEKSAMSESFGTECCEVITSMRQGSLLMLPPCKHIPAKPELTHRNNGSLSVQSKLLQMVCNNLYVWNQAYWKRWIM